MKDNVQRIQKKSFFALTHKTLEVDLSQSLFSLLQNFFWTLIERRFFENISKSFLKRFIKFHNIKNMIRI